MNGIAGAVQLDGASIDPAALDAPVRAMARDGAAAPDTIVRGAAVFACLGSSSPNNVLPPQVLARGELAIVADARIDGIDELCDALGIPAGERRALPDAELVLRSYERWGQACPEHLIGDYAFAIWDGARRTFFAARDHIGVRPFYYAMIGGQFVFASEIRGVLAFDGVPAEIDEAEVARYLISVRPGYFDPEHTFFTAVRKLPFGHRLSVGPSGLRVERYWRPEQVPSLTLCADVEYAERLRALVEQALRDRLRDVRHAGVHLSGGLDSSALAVLTNRMARGRGMTVAAYSWSPPPDAVRGAEHDRIDAVAKAEGLTPEYVPISLADSWRFDGDISVVPRIGVIAETPVAELAAAGGAGVMVSGWGGDEAASSAGRGIAAGYLRSGRLRAFLRYCRERAAADRAHARIRGAVVVAWREGCVPLLPERLFHAQRKRAREDGPRLISEGLVSRVRAQLRPPSGVGRDMPGGRANMLLAYRRGTSAARIESWGRFRAGLGVTYVYPLTDRRILEFIYAIPEGLHVRRGIRRALFREAMSGVLPDGWRWAPVKEENARFAWMMRESCEAERAGLLARLDTPGLAWPHPWVDVARLRASLASMPADAPLPTTVEHALAVLTIWRNWGSGVR